MVEKSVSVLRETREGDKRVILMPQEAKKFVAAGFRVYVEHDAGSQVGCSDADYRSAGATIVSNDDAWTASDYLIKCRCPSADEYRHFRPGLHLGATFYLGDKEDLAEAFLESRANAYSYELFRAADGTFPLMTTDSEISGHMAVIYGAYHLQNQLGGSGVMLGYMPGVRRPKVVVIGHGNVGGAAARTASALGAEVVVLGTNEASLRRLEAAVPGVRCYLNSLEVLEREIPDADLVVGAILISMYATPAMIDRELVRKMKPGSVIVDVTCGYGPGYLPTADKRTRDLADAYFVEGVKHFKNDCIPKLVHMTATPAVSANACPYLINLGHAIFEPGFTDAVSEAGRIVNDGVVVHPQVMRELKAKAAKSLTVH